MPDEMDGKGKDRKETYDSQFSIGCSGLYNKFFGIPSALNLMLNLRLTRYTHGTANTEPEELPFGLRPQLAYHAREKESVVRAIIDGVYPTEEELALGRMGETGNAEPYMPRPHIMSCEYGETEQLTPEADHDALAPNRVIIIPTSPQKIPNPDDPLGGLVGRLNDEILRDDDSDE